MSFVSGAPKYRQAGVKGQQLPQEIRKATGAISQFVNERGWKATDADGNPVESTGFGHKNGVYGKSILDLIFQKKEKSGEMYERGVKVDGMAKPKRKKGSTV